MTDDRETLCKNDIWTSKLLQNSGLIGGLPSLVIKCLRRITKQDLVNASSPCHFLTANEANRTYLTTVTHVTF